MLKKATCTWNSSGTRENVLESGLKKTLKNHVACFARAVLMKKKNPPKAQK